VHLNSFSSVGSLMAASTLVVCEEDVFCIAVALRRVALRAGVFACVANEPVSCNARVESPSLSGSKLLFNLFASLILLSNSILALEKVTKNSS
jgi:hypothetical protein